MKTIYLLAKPQQELSWFNSFDELKAVASIGDEIITLYPDGVAVKATWAKTPTGEQLAQLMAEYTLWNEQPQKNEILATLANFNDDEQAKVEYIRLLAESYQDTAEMLAGYQGGNDGQ